MKLNKQTLQPADIIDTLVPEVIRYRLLIGVIALVGVVAFVASQVSTNSNVERNNDVYLEQISLQKKLEFDQATIDTIRALNNSNIDIDSNLPQDRTNPF